MDTPLTRARRAGHPLTALMAALLCGLALAACGSDSDSGGGSDEDQVREIAEQLVSNDPAACSKLSDAFVEEVVTKEECEKSAEEDVSGETPTVDDIEVDGETATAVVIDEDRSTLGFVKEDDEWLVDSVEVEEGAGKSSSGEEEEATPEETETAAEPSEDASAGGDEVAAQAAVDAFLLGVKEEDPAILCGLFSERYAKELTGAKEFGIAECVDELEGGSFAELQNTLKGVKVQTTTVATGGKSASVKLSNGNSVELEYQDGRFVIDEL